MRKDLIETWKKRINQLRREEKRFINLNPIQRGGILSPEARKILDEFADGYSLCDWCTGSLYELKRPPVLEFLEDLASFLGTDVGRVVTRCREAKYIIFKTLAEPGDVIVVDGLAHYSTFLAAEAAGLKVVQVEHSGYPSFELKLEEYQRRIEEIKRTYRKPPALVLLTHADPTYGNLGDVKKVSKICREEDIPFVLNAAYTAGVMPVDCKELGVDLLVSSGHKSWAASGPIGILAMRREYAAKVLRRSSSFPKKELAVMGCPVLGLPLVTLMASFPYVMERVKSWESELEKTRYLVNKLEEIQGTIQLGVKPKQHHLIHMESKGFEQVSKRVKERGYFLYHELKERGVVGILPGRSKHFKLSVYGLEWGEVKRVAEVFQEIAKKYGVM